MFAYGFARNYHLPNSNFWLVFSGTLFVYLGQRYYKIWKKDFTLNANRINWMLEHTKIVKALLGISFIGFCILACTYMFVHPRSILLFVISGVVSTLYVVRVGRWNLREIPYLKVFFVVGVYFILTIGLNMQEHHLAFDSKIASYLFLIFGLTILFDIPDIKIDIKENRTIAQELGVKWTIILSFISVLIYFLLKDYRGGSIGMAGNAVLALIILTFYIKLPKKVFSEFYLAFYGEGILGLFGVYYYLIL